MIVLVGFMGAGKSTVGSLVAERLGLPFADSDRLAESRAGRSIREIFEAEGEPAFRDLEREVVLEALSGGTKVVALGGGAPSDPEVQKALAASGVRVVGLDVSLDEARSRLGAAPDRPLLSSPDLGSLWEERRTLYRSVADSFPSVDGKSPEAVVEEVLRSVSAPTGIDLTTASGTCRIVVGGNLDAERLREALVPALVEGPPEKVFAVTHSSLLPIARPVTGVLEEVAPVHLLEVPEGEEAKSPEVAEALWGTLAERAAHRSDLVVGIGGGVITDLAGFVASTFNRGMPVVHVPTTLLGQVDAAIGGKTGVNLSQGKNLVGTFYQPRAVICDVAHLRTLPEAELVSGLAEVAKYGFISDPSLLHLLMAKSDALVERDPHVLGAVVRISAGVKASIVSADEREFGLRARLNYGHTFGHAIETTLGYGAIRHGEAVSIGMMAAAYLAEGLGRISEEEVALHRRVLEAVALPVSAELDLAAIEEAWLRDKKYSAGVRFVLLEGIGEPEIGVAAPREKIESALKRLAERVSG